MRYIIRWRFFHNEPQGSRGSFADDRKQGVLMNKKKYRAAAVVIALMVAVLAVGFAAPDRFAAGTEKAAAQEVHATKATEKKKKKNVTLNIIVMSEKDAEVDLTITRMGKKKKDVYNKSLELKDGLNYLSYPKAWKGKYRINLNAYGDDLTSQVTVLSGMYTVFFNIAPPKDGDAKDKNKMNYQILK